MYLKATQNSGGVFEVDFAGLQRSLSGTFEVFILFFYLIFLFYILSWNWSLNEHEMLLS